MTDGGDFLQTVLLHRYFKTHAETLAEGVKAGVDAMLDSPAEVAKAAREAFILEQLLFCSFFTVLLFILSGIIVITHWG